MFGVLFFLEEVDYLLSSTFFALSATGATVESAATTVESTVVAVESVLTSVEVEPFPQDVNATIDKRANTFFICFFFLVNVFKNYQV